MIQIDLFFKYYLLGFIIQSYFWLPFSISKFISRYDQKVIMEHFRDSKLYEADVTESLQNTGLDNRDITQIIKYINTIIERKAKRRENKSSFEYISLYTSCPKCEELAARQTREDINMASLGVYAEMSDYDFESSNFSESEYEEEVDDSE